MSTCHRSAIWCLPTLLVVSVTTLAVGADRPQRSRRVLYNFDGDSCLSTKAGGKGPVAVNADDVKRLIEEVAYDGSRVDTVLVCINAQVMYYPTKVGTMRGRLSTPEERARWPASEKQRFANLKEFFDAGVDPYAIMLAEARRRGREALLTFRMNDDHGDDFLRTQFLVDHPDWRLGDEKYRGKGAMDFGRDEVRDYTYRLIEEAARRYDCDGIELDFNRFPAFFKDGSTDERVAKMNSLVERVRQMLDDVGRARSRRLVLSVRPPSNFGRTPPTPDTARQIGCDVPFWVKNGWVDFVAVSEFLFERGDLPIGLWRQAITTVPVYGGIECAKAGGKQNLTSDEYRHAATQLIKSGADGVYLFNFFTSREGGAEAYEPPFDVLRELGSLNVGFCKPGTSGFGYAESADGLSFTKQADVRGINFAEDYTLAVDIAWIPYHDGKPVTRWAADTYKATKTNELHWQPHWNKHPDLSSLRSRIVRLKFHLRDAKLYSFQVGA